MYDPPMVHHSTAEHYSPHDLLPAPLPSSANYPLRYFYENVAKHLLKDSVRIMHNGIHIDPNQVENLKQTLNVQLAEVESALAANPLIRDFQLLQHRKLVAVYREERRSHIRSVEHFIKKFSPKNKIHRSYFMHIYAEQQSIPSPTNIIEGTTIPEWSAALVKKLATTRPILTKLLDDELAQSHPIVHQAMQLLAEHKAEKHNRKFLDQLENPDLEVPPFSPASPTQKRDLFEWLGIESEATSKDTGLPSWDRDQIERVHNESTDPQVVDFTQHFINHSFAAIVRNNFIEAFNKFSVNNRLHGTIRIFGAKSFRPTSNNPKFWASVQ